MSAESTAIVIDHLSCQFRNSEALHDVSLRIDKGKVFGLVGLNGAGKTTLIRHLIGGLRPMQGSVRVLGEAPTVTPESLLQRIGYMAEEDVLPRWMKVRELLRFRKAFYLTWDDNLCNRLLQTFELSVDSRLSDLSKGQRARIGLLIALVHQPELLILDEPSYGLDPLAREDILEAVVNLASEDGRTVLFSSHLLDEVARVCDDVAVIHQGRIREVISVAEISSCYSELTCQFDFALQRNELPGLFGWQRHGSEWSVLVNHRISKDPEPWRGQAGLHVLDVRPASLERWFAGHVRSEAKSASDLHAVQQVVA